MTLKAARADAKLAGDILDSGPAAGKLFLNGGMDALAKGLLPLVLFQLFIELRREHGQQFGVAGHKWTGSVGGSKHDRVARGSENYPAPEMTFQTFWIGAWSNQFEPKRGQARSGTVARDGQDPGETNIGEDLGLNIIGQQPAE